MNECWGNEWVVSANDRDGSIRTRQVPVKVKRGLSLHARRPQQRTPPSIDRAAKSTWFNEARGPHPPWPIFNSFFFCCIELKCNRLFLVFTLPTRVAFGTRWFVEHSIRTPIPILFWRPDICKRKIVEIRFDVCVEKPYTLIFGLTHARNTTHTKQDVIYQINPPCSTYGGIPNTVVTISPFFHAQSVTLNRPLLRKKKAVKLETIFMGLNRSCSD